MVCFNLIHAHPFLATCGLGWLPGCPLHKEQGLRLGKFGCTVTWLWTYLLIIIAWCSFGQLGCDFCLRKWTSQYLLNQSVCLLFLSFLKLLWGQVIHGWDNASVVRFVLPVLHAVKVSCEVCPALPLFLTVPLHSCFFLLL